jgi:Protein of unknown function (DUF4242)
MPRYIVQRTFPEGFQIPADAGGADLAREMIECNGQDGVTWIHSFCLYDAPNPEAIRSTSSRSKLPVDQITQVRVLDPYSYA